MVTRIHAQLKEGKNHRRPVYVWQQWAKLEEFLWWKTCSKCLRDESHVELSQDKVINIQRISTLRKQNNKGEKHSESFPTSFEGYYEKRKVFYQ